MSRKQLTAREFATRKYKPRYTPRHNSIWKLKVRAFLEGVQWERNQRVTISGKDAIDVALCTAIQPKKKREK